MIEISESTTISRQATELLTGKTVSQVINATSPHKFTWYNGDPADYPAILSGCRIEAVRGYGAFVDLVMTDRNTHLLIGDGTHMRYYHAEEAPPSKHQQLIVLDDESYLVFTVAMYGGIYAFQGGFNNPYYQGSIRKPNPLSEDFD